MGVDIMSIKRKVDDLGRICIPSELRNQLGIGASSNVEIDIRDDSIIIKPTSNDITDKIKSKIEVFQNQLKRNIGKKERLQTEYALEVLQELLKSNKKKRKS